MHPCRIKSNSNNSFFFFLNTSWPKMNGTVYLTANAKSKRVKAREPVSDVWSSALFCDPEVFWQGWTFLRLRRRSPCSAVFFLPSPLPPGSAGETGWRRTHSWHMSLLFHLPLPPLSPILLHAVSIQVIPVSGSTPPHHSLWRALFQDAFNLHCILGVAACCRLQMGWWGEFGGGTRETHFTGLQVDGPSLLSVREVRRQMKTRKLNWIFLKLKWKKGL